MKSNVPIVVFIGAHEKFGTLNIINVMSSGDFGSGNTKWEVVEFLRPGVASVPPPPVPSPDPLPLLRAFAGTWDAKDISFTIDADGRGRAELGKLNCGAASFTFDEGASRLR